MHRKLLIVMLATAVAVPFAVTQSLIAQSKTLASTMNVYVFPKAGQDATQQSKDEASCYDWAVQNTGDDPFDVQASAEQQKQQAAQQEQAAKDATKGKGAKGALGGAAAGALIGEIASDDPGKGAAYGAAAGLLAGRRRSKKAKNQAEQQAEQQTQQIEQSSAGKIDAFRKAFSVCLEAKDYMVKY